MKDVPDKEALGTLMRHILDAVDADVAAVYRQLGASDYRPRFSPPIRVLASHGPLSIRDLAGHVGLTHSAASQTVAQMQRKDFVSLRSGTDARQRIVHLTPRARTLLPLIEAEWTATTAAIRDLDAELPMPLSTLLTQAAQALRQRPMRQRIAEAGVDFPPATPAEGPI